MDDSKTQFLKQVKADVDGDVLIGRSTWAQVLDIALEQQAAHDQLLANARPMTAAPELLEALREGDRAENVLVRMQQIEESRDRGVHGIRHATDDLAREWQELEAELDAIRERRYAAIAKATGQ